MRRIDEIKRDAEAATPGPWTANESIEGYCVEDSTGEHTACYCWKDRGNHKADAAFIANARTDIPDLVALVERLRDALEPFANMRPTWRPGEQTQLLLIDRTELEDARAALAAAGGTDGARDTKCKCGRDSIMGPNTGMCADCWMASVKCARDDGQGGT